MVSTPGSAGKPDVATPPEQRGVFAKRPGKQLGTAYSQDARGDCRPAWGAPGTGNFTIGQANRFPQDKKPLGADGDYNPGFQGSIEHRAGGVPPKKPKSPAFKDKQTKLDAAEKSTWHTPTEVGPSTYLRHNSWLEGKEGNKTYCIGGSSLRSKAERSVYGPGGMANLGMVASPKRVNCYTAHDHKNEWNKKGAQGANPLHWSKKGSTIQRATRFDADHYMGAKITGAPGPGDYHGSLSKPYSSLNTKIMFRDPDAIKEHRYGTISKVRASTAS